MARRYRLRGPEPVQRKLLAGLTAAGITGASILEIGCGTGELQRRVLAAGAASALGIDISGGMIEQARVTAERTGTAPRTTYLVGDAVERAEELSPAAVVLLDKVLCCYPDIDPLLAVSLERAQRLYAVVVPRPHWLVAVGWRLGIALFRLLRSSFHPYYHDWQRTAATIEASGFRRIFAASTLAWEAWIFRRQPGTLAEGNRVGDRYASRNVRRPHLPRLGSPPARNGRRRADRTCRRSPARPLQLPGTGRHLPRRPSGRAWRRGARAEP